MVLGSEFKKGFGKHLGLKHYFLNIGPHKKVGIIERSIRSYKKIFFRLLLRFPTEKYSNLIHLTQICYNSTRHSALFNQTPHRVQVDAHMACLVMQKQLRQYSAHQLQTCKMLQNLKSSARLSLGDTVRIRTEKSIIRKESSVFSPQLTEELHVVTKIDRSKLPYVFTLDSKDSMRYYALGHSNKHKCFKMYRRTAKHIQGVI